MISIIMAAYNSGNTIRNCLDSIIEQTLQDWECIVIDGVSKDNTLEILAEYAVRDNRISYLSEPDNGIYDALNKGIKRAKGIWLYVIGSDDILLKEGLSTLISESKPDSDVIYGNIVCGYINGKKRVIKPHHISHIRHYMPISHQGVIVKTADAQALDGFDLRYKCKGDFNMIQRLYLSDRKFQYVDTNICLSGMEGLSNKLSSIVKYDLERYYINKCNKSNPIPALSWAYIELRSLASTFRDKLLKRK